MGFQYDTLGAPAQLGSNLNVYSSNGWPPAWPAFSGSSGFPWWFTYWDGETPTTLGTPLLYIPGQETFVDLCLHQGELHAAWVEPQWDGSKKVMRGPFVKKWTGAAWVAVGGEVDPAITAVQESQYPNPSGALGTRSAPARPVLVSDGTDLYCAYTVREVATVAQAVPNGVWVSTFPCGCYTPSCNTTDYTKWTPRKGYVRKWDGVSWVLYGDIPAQTNNAARPRGPGQPNFYDNQPSGRVFMSACASPAEPGKVYVAWSEAGAHAAIMGWSTSPACIFGIQFGTPTDSGASMVTRVIQFDGGTTTGTSKTLDLITRGPTAPPGPNMNGMGPWPAFVDNSTGTAWVFWAPAKLTGTTALRMTDWATLVDAQVDANTSTTPTANGYSTGAAPFAVGRDDTRGVFYVQIAYGSSALVREVAQDGLTAFTALNAANVGTAAQVPFGVLLNSFYRRIDGDQGRNVWGIPVFASSDPGKNIDSQYHFECPDWSGYSYVSGDSTHTAGIGAPILIRDGDTVYAAGAFYDPTSSAVDFSVRVFTADICRDCGFCGSPTETPFLNNRFRTGPLAGGGTGTSGRFLNPEYEIGAIAGGGTGATGAFIKSWTYTI